MIPEFVTSAILGMLVFGGLAFHDVIADRLAGISRDGELTDFNDID